jgi:hypothetical protein
MKIEIEITDEQSDAILLRALRSTMESTGLCGDEPEYDAKIIEACKLIISHYTEPPR